MLPCILHDSCNNFISLHARSSLIKRGDSYNVMDTFIFTALYGYYHWLLTITSENFFLIVLSLLINKLYQLFLEEDNLLDRTY